MPQLTPFAISGLLSIVVNLPLYLFILAKGKTKLARIFSLFILSIFGWGIGSLFIGLNNNAELAVTIWKWAYADVLLIPVFYYHATALLIKRKADFVIPLMYLQAIIFVALIFTNQMMSQVRYMFNSFYYHVATPAYAWSFVVWTFIAITSNIQLIRHYQRSYPEQKGQIQTLILASIGFLGAIMNFIPGFGINIYPYGNFGVPFYAVIVAYAILKHQFLGIEIVVKKGLIYSILLVVISSIYLLIVVVSEKILQGYFGYSSMSISILVAFVLGILFFPLRNKIQSLIDKTIFLKSPSELAQENALLRREVAQTERLRTLATLAGGIAHEIKNPLTAITTFSEYLPKKLHDEEFLQKFSQIVGSEASRIDDLVNQLLDFARPAPAVLKKTDINKLIQDSVSLLNSKLLKHNITVHHESNELNGTLLNIDQNKIKQALLNILLNAIDAMPNGGTLKVTAAPTQFPDAHGRRLVKIAIQDSGAGIAAEDLPYIFDPFFTKKDSGTGLGLAITHGIIHEHGGTITALSTPGQGTTFEITLPAEE